MEPLKTGPIKGFEGGFGMPKGVGERERERGRRERLSEHQFKAICKSLQASYIGRHCQRLSYRLL